MLICQDVFTLFLARYASKYQYSEVLITRRKFHVKWLTTNKPTKMFEIPRQTPTHSAIPSSTLQDDTVQYMIITKEVLPAPPVMSKVLDWMECSGQKLDQLWYHKVVN